jgi:glycosyltransferase involved in cell wall biosynthesis
MSDFAHCRGIKVLLSAYACEPSKGSEPGVGWKWACGLAGRVELTVLTRGNNRAPIEKAVSNLHADHPLRQVRLLYHDAGPLWRLMKRLHLLPTLLYYFIWQWTAARRFGNEADASDIVHHLTFCTALCPGFWNKTKAARVIGPVAAPLVPEHYLALFGIRRLSQALRNHLIRNFLKLPWLKKSFVGAAAVVPANSDMKHLLEAMGVSCEDVMLDTGAPSECADIDRSAKPSSSCKFLYAGVIERRKGLELALRAFARFIQNSKLKIKNQAPPTLTLLGKGPDRERIETLAHSLGISELVHFPGAVPQSEVARHFAEADVFLFTSVRDASGGVNLEAMASGLPILCIAHQGVGDITDDTCAIRIPPGAIKETIASLVDGMQRMANDPNLRIDLGANARRRAQEKFSWKEKFERMMKIYQSVVRTEAKLQ